MPSGHRTHVSAQPLQQTDNELNLKNEPYKKSALLSAILPISVTTAC
jgi:hypothetical protein